MCVNNLPNVATQWNSGATWDSNRGRRVLIPSALTNYTKLTAKAFIPVITGTRSVKIHQETRKL